LFNPDRALEHLKSALNEKEENCTWLNGFNYKITVRRTALRPLHEFAKERLRNAPHVDRTGFRLPTPGTIRLLGKLVWMIEDCQPTA
jgi:hypothetical protein